MLAAALFPLILFGDGSLSRLDGVLLLLIYLLYHLLLLKDNQNYYSVEATLKPSLFGRWLHSLKKNPFSQEWGGLLLATIILVFSGVIIIETGGMLAVDLGMPLFVVGLTFVALGTSLPELSVEIRSLKKKKVGMVFGNLLGSVVTNSTLILGVSALIKPISIKGVETQFWLASGFFLLSFLLLWLFIRTKFKLQRWEGMVLIGMYLLFILLLFIS